MLDVPENGDGLVYSADESGRAVGSVTVNKVDTIGIWQRTKLAIPIRLAGQPGIAMGTLAGGLIVGESGRVNQKGSPFALKGTSLVALRVLAGSTSGSASACNTNGEIVGFCHGNSGFHATLWNRGGVVDLNDVVSKPDGFHLELASSINGRGEIVGNGGLKDGARAFLLVPKR